MSYQLQVIKLLEKLTETTNDLWTKLSKLEGDVLDLAKDVNTLLVKQEQVECEHAFGSTHCYRCGKPNPEE